jgi:ParB/Sulfiredoxin domain
VSRWHRLNRAQNELAILPPIEVVKHGGRYWVIDGHNRVASALYNGQPEIDATIVELVPPGERRSEPVLDLAPTLSGSRTLRTRAEGRPASGVLGHEDRRAPDRDVS